MQPTTLQYKLIKKIKDDRFDEEYIQDYLLLVAIGTRDFQIAVVEPIENKVLLLEDFVLPNLASNEELNALLDQLFDSHSLLKVGFWKKIIISFKSSKFVQVPEALFDDSAAYDYLKFNAHTNPQQEVYLIAHSQLSESATVFAINTDLHTWIRKLYPGNAPVFTHQSTALIEGILRIAATETGKPLYIFVDRFKLHIAYCLDGKLIYYNQFIIKQFSDYVRYIMLVMKSLDLNPDTNRVVLWGYIGKNSPHYHEFYKYIRNVSFGSRLPELNFSYFFDEVQEHHFFDLFSLYSAQH